jgi:hypothetical protein
LRLSPSASRRSKALREVLPKRPQKRTIYISIYWSRMRVLIPACAIAMDAARTLSGGAAVRIAATRAGWLAGTLRATSIKSASRQRWSGGSDYALFLVSPQIELAPIHGGSDPDARDGGSDLPRFDEALRSVMAMHCRYWRIAS